MCRSSAVVLPFALGALLALHLVADHPTGDRLAFVLFLGTAMSMTAFPVLARILTDKGLIDTPIGGLALAAAAVDDVLAWSMLAAVAALAGAGGAPWQLLLVLPYAAALVWIVRPLLARRARREATADRPVGRLTARLTDAGVLLALAAGLLLSARATEWMGLAPDLRSVPLRHRHAARGRLETAPARPAAGRTTLLLSSCSRCSSWWPASRSTCRRWTRRRSASWGSSCWWRSAASSSAPSSEPGSTVCDHVTRPCLAVLINTRGLTELIVLDGRTATGVLDQPLYSLMVVMALITTAMAGVLLPFVYPDERIRQDLAARDRADASGGDASALSEK